jgi:hypothetical protein
VPVLALQHLQVIACLSYPLALVSVQQKFVSILHIVFDKRWSMKEEIYGWRCRYLGNRVGSESADASYTEDVKAWGGLSG